MRATGDPPDGKGHRMLMQRDIRYKWSTIKTRQLVYNPPVSGKKH